MQRVKERSHVQLHRQKNEISEERPYTLLVIPKGTIEPKNRDIIAKSYPFAIMCLFFGSMVLLDRNHLAKVHQEEG
jgi:hypothetical protein